MNLEFQVSTAYSFVPSETETDLTERKLDLETLAAKSGLRGLVILAPEGFNGTVCGKQEAIAAWKSWIRKWYGLNVILKNSASDRQAFLRFRIKLRSEIVTLKRPDLNPPSQAARGLQVQTLDPEEWNALLDDPDSVCIDTRNWYETRVGTFEKAKDPGISSFTEFSDFFQSTPIDKNKKIMIFCTGGIRCEKAGLELLEKGYENVYQLSGGILNYFQKIPPEKNRFQGECFVFDHRVAVTPELKPTETWGLCPHTGQPGQHLIQCARCGSEAKLSAEAIALGDERSQTCSKNCAHHWKLRPGQKGPKQPLSEDQKIYQSDIDRA